MGIKLKKQFDLQKDIHFDLLEDIAFKALSGIKVCEILELREIYKKDQLYYFNQIKLKYNVFLSTLDISHGLSLEIMDALFTYIDYVIRNIDVDGLNTNSKFLFHKPPLLGWMS